MNPFVTPGQKPLSILLVEDDDGDAQALKRAFQKARIANLIMRAVDGIEALDILKGTNGKTRPPSPAIMLVDLNMPRMNGIQLVQALRADEGLRRSIVFVLTTSKRDEDKTAAYNLNVAGYISKERAAEDFLNLVSMIDCYGSIVELP
jgi:CheY-like chemotaxis protein